MSKAGTSAPPTINPFQLGANQAESNVATAAAQAGLNNVNTTSPFGSSTFTPYGTGPNGIGPAGYTLNQTLNPTIQSAFNNEASLAAALSGAAGGVAPWAYGPAQAGGNLVSGGASGLQGILPWTAGPAEGGNNLIAAGINAAGSAPTSLNFSGLNPLTPGSASDLVSAPGTPGNGGAIGQAENATFNEFQNLEGPLFQQQNEQLQQQLADQGIPLGSTAGSNAYGNLSRQQDYQTQQAANAAVQAGQQEQGNLFGQGLGARQQQVGEQEAQAAFPLAAASQLGSLGESILGGAIGDTSSILGAGENVLGGAEGGINSLWPLADFSASGNVPTTVGNTNISPANIVGAGQVGTSSGLNSFLAGNTLNSQLFNGLGSLGGALGLGSGGLGTTLFGSGGLSGLFGSGGLFGGAGGLALTGGL